MDVHTPVCDLLCCDQPIILAGMGGVARSELVASVAEAGGFGFLGMVRESPELIGSEIAAVRARSARAFGVNLIPAATKPALLEAELSVCVAAKVHAVALFWDLSPAVIARLRAAGILVVCQVGSVAEARAAERAGADILIAQGWEAGGHVRGEIALQPLVRDIVSQVNAPVLAAGGIVDGAGMAAAMMLGAQGVVMGTAFLATSESFAHDYHKQRIVDAGPDDTIHTEVFHINWPTGAAVRVLSNSVTRSERGDPHAVERVVIGAEGQRDIFLFSTDSPLRSTTGEFEAMALYAGQGVGRLADIVPAGDRLRAIAAEARALLIPPVRPTGRETMNETSSPVCYADAAPDSYMGFATREDLVAELNILLEAERAGARVGARLAAQAEDAELKALSRVIHEDEGRWCKMLFAAIVELGAEPSTKVGDFYEKAMEISDLDDRLAFVNRGQGWVVRKLQTLTPKVRDDRLHASLREMLEAHVANIARANETLERRAASI